ncbi:MAG: hypothetical protein WBD36_03685 [Bacteroidota bacterium]
MRNAFAFGFLLLFLLSGCFTSRTIVWVATDGSGTVEQTVVYGNKKFSFGMDSTAGEMNSTDSKKPDFDEMASDMGPGVRFVSEEEVVRENGHGYKALFRFEDVSKLKLSMWPSEKSKSDSGSFSISAPVNKDDKIAFQFIPGSPATLIINMPPPKEQKKEEKKKKQSKEEEQMSVMAMRMFLEGLKIYTAVEVQGTIVESDASFKSSYSVVLADIDFDKLLADEKGFNRLTQAETASVEEQKKLMKEAKGIKIELNPKVTIKFK